MGFLDRLTGKTAAAAATQAAEVQAGFAQQAGDLYQPFQQLGQQGLEQASFLTDPNQQFDFLQENPLFQLSLDQGNEALTGITKFAAAKGRLSAGDTLQQLQQSGQRNALLAASPLIQQQKNSIGDLLRTGQNVVGNQANLLTGQGAATAGGIVGAENARSAGYGNLINLGGQIAGAVTGNPFAGSFGTAAGAAAPAPADPFRNIGIV
tara:strand:+ start:912 stop:1535 length:624 start_codon:yes stop_codon:yes gene_type:complete